MRFYRSLFVLVLGRLHVLWPPATQRHYRCSWLLFLSVGAWVGALLTRVPWRGLLLRTAWASNSCDKCSSHGDGGRFSQTNNGRMFICGSPHLGRSACLPLSLDRGIGVCLSFSLWFICLCLSSLVLYFFDSFSGLQRCSFYCRPTPQRCVKMSHVHCTYRAPAKSVSPAVWHLSSVNSVTGLTLSSLTQGFVLRRVSPFESGPWFTNQPCVQCAPGNPTHNSAMVTERMKTSALWQQINGSLSPRIRRTLNKIWHNSIILKQALSKHTVPHRRRRERCCRGTPHRRLKVLTVFVNILNPLSVFPSFTSIHLERGLL